MDWWPQPIGHYAPKITKMFLKTRFCLEFSYVSNQGNHGPFPIEGNHGPMPPLKHAKDW